MRTPKRTAKRRSETALLGWPVRSVRIACINRAKTPLGMPLSKLTAALQKCYDKHFLPVWGFPVRLYNTTKPKPSDWQLIYFDAPDHKHVEGFHQLTHRGQPLAKVFVQSSLDDDVPVSVTASHELFEMVIDPMANLWANADKRTQYAYEMCDAVEEDVFTVDDVPMSNFLHPAWFEPFKHPRGTRFDHLGRLKKPFSMTAGGYVIVRRDGKLKKKFGSMAKARRFAREDRRGHRSEFRDPHGLHVGPRRRRAK